MVEIIDFYRQTHTHMIFVLFSEDGRKRITNGYFMVEPSPTRMSDLKRVKNCNVTDLCRNLNSFFPQHELTKLLRGTKKV